MPKRPYSVEGLYAAVTCVQCTGRGTVRKHVTDRNGELITCPSCDGRKVTMRMITLGDLRELLGLPT